MSEQTSATRPGAQARVQLDGLATRLMVGGDLKEFTLALKKLSEMAGKEGLTETACLATQLAEAIKSSNDPETLENTVKQGLSILQEVLASEDEQSAAAQQSAAVQRPAVNPLSQDPELVGDFVMESREHLSSIESQMLALEQNPEEGDVIHAVFRSFHTIKGLAGFLEFATIQKVAHEVETLLDLARNGKLTMSTSVVDVVLESADFLTQAISNVEASLPGDAMATAKEPGDLLRRIQLTYSSDSFNPASAPRLAGEESKAPASEPSIEILNDDEPLREHAERSSVPGGSRTAYAAKAETISNGAKSADTFSVRVETFKLDHLLDMVGEMVIAQSLIRHNPKLAALQDPRLLSDLSLLARITADVQRTTMGLRMIPMGQLFQRTARMVRELSRKTGKKVELQVSGEETELDKSIAEELSDPLLHMVRNSLDHGIENPEGRRTAGKSETALVRLSAYHRAGQIIVEIADDGRGLDKAKILKKAQQKGLVHESQHISESDIFNLIFEPGFSTADKISDISGRGVGMDVVRKNVQKLRGRIDVQSVAGKGANFTLSLPLTLAIIDGLVVEVGSRRYIAPLFDVREMIRPTQEIISSVQGREEMALIRGRLLPIVRLSQRFNVEPRSENICDGLLVVAECDGMQFCLLVDDLAGKQEVVIKSLGATLKNINGIAGCAILGDGRVGLILDMHGVFKGNQK